MGKARIVSGGTAGLYEVEILLERAHIESEKQDLAAAIVQIDEEMGEVQEWLDLAELEVSEARIHLEAIISEWEEGEEWKIPDMADLVDAHNLIRSQYSLPPLVGEQGLHKAAQDHASWLRTNDIGGHEGVGGSTPLQRIITAGFPVAPDGSGGENVAAGTKTVETSIVAWMNSPGHRANILKEKWTHIGVGYARRTDGAYRHFWVVTFGEPGTDQIPTEAAPLPVDLLDNGNPMAVPDALIDAQLLLVQAAKDRDLIALEHDSLSARKISAGERLQALNDIPPNPVQPAWCADYTENLTGEVSAAEIPGENTDRVILRPGSSPLANEMPDGIMHHRAGMTGPQAFFNAAILPGWQRWMPLYRIGVLTAVDKDEHLGSVTLVSETSSAQGLPINQVASLSDVPIVYMDCNADAFEQGDRVLVEFINREWSSPRIIGFESNPRECAEWPEHVLIQVLLNALDGDMEFIPSAAPIPFITQLSGNCGCSVSASSTTAPLRRKKSLSYGGAGAVRFVMESGDDDVSGAFSADIEGLEHGVIIDEKWENYLAFAPRLPDYYDEDGNEQTELSLKNVESAIASTSGNTTNVRWIVEKFSDYHYLTLPLSNLCGNTFAGWAGRTDDSNFWSTTTRLSSAVAGCEETLIAGPVTRTRYLMTGDDTLAIYANVTEFAIAQGAITGTIHVEAVGSQKQFVANGFAKDGAQAYMRFTRQDLMPSD